MSQDQHTSIQPTTPELESTSDRIVSLAESTHQVGSPSRSPSPSPERTMMVSHRIHRVSRTAAQSPSRQENARSRQRSDPPSDFGGSMILSIPPGRHRHGTTNRGDRCSHAGVANGTWTETPHQMTMGLASEWGSPFSSDLPEKLQRVYEMEAMTEREWTTFRDLERKIQKWKDQLREYNLPDKACSDCKLPCFDDLVCCNAFLCDSCYHRRLGSDDASIGNKCPQCTSLLPATRVPGMGRLLSNFFHRFQEESLPCVCDKEILTILNLEHLQKCIHRPVSCRSCSFWFRASDLEAHLASSCPVEMIVRQAVEETTNALKKSFETEREGKNREFNDLKRKYERVSASVRSPSVSSPRGQSLSSSSIIGDKERESKRKLRAERR